MQKRNPMDVKIKPTWQMTHNQSIALAYCVKFSAFLSNAGSVIVCYQILAPERRNAMLKTMYNRIVLTISLMDIIGSLAFFMSTWPIPSDTLHDEWIYGNIGNQTTCNIQGYFMQGGVLSTGCSTSCLCLYFMLLVRYNWTERRLKKVEMGLRGVIVFNFAIALIPLFDKGYNPVPYVCWIQSYPIDCDTSDEYECLRGDNAKFLRTVFMTVPFVIILVVIVVSMTLLYLSVKKQESSVSQYRSYRASNRSRKVFTKAVWFIGSYIFMWIPGAVLTELTKRGIYSYGAVQYVSIVVPLQGFFNAIIYNYEKLTNIDILGKSSSIMSSMRISRASRLRPIQQIVMESEGVIARDTTGSNTRDSISPDSIPCDMEENNFAQDRKSDISKSDC